MSPGKVVFDSFDAAASRYARYRAVERRLFEVVGGWVPSAPEPPAKLGLRALSFGHARRAALWEALLPVAWTDEEGVEATATLAGARPLVDAAAALEGTPARAVVLASGLLPLLGRTYREEAGRLSVAAGGPARRALGLAEASLAADQGAARRLAEAFPVPSDPGAGGAGGEGVDKVLAALAEWHHLV